jgi:hypothetical protein
MGLGDDLSFFLPSDSYIPLRGIDVIIIIIYYHHHNHHETNSFISIRNKTSHARRESKGSRQLGQDKKTSRSDKPRRKEMTFSQVITKYHHQRRGTPSKKYVLKQK